jgi:hypothetical protein
MAKNLAESDRKQKPYLSASEPDKISFVGVDGATITLDGVAPGGRHEKVLYVMAIKGDTTYLLSAVGAAGDIAAAAEDLHVIQRGVRTLVEVNKVADAPPPPPDAPPPPPPPPAEPPWSKEPPLRAPPPEARHLVSDAMLGVRVERLDGWGVATGQNGYTIERRLDGKTRVVASIWLGSEKLSGGVEAYVQQVADQQTARRDRFGGADALIIERPPRLAGAGDVLEVHVLRGETPLVLSLRFDGGAWKDPAGRERLAELERATRVTGPGKPGSTVVVAGGVARVKVGRGWSFEKYGPGAAAIWKKDAMRARVAVYSRGVAPAVRCDTDDSPPAGAPAQFAGRSGSVYSCPNAATDQLVYTVLVGEYTVHVGFTDSSSSKDPAAVAAEFGRFLKL